jgi:hypothetical protein
VQISCHKKEVMPKKKVEANELMSFDKVKAQTPWVGDGLYVRRP